MQINLNEKRKVAAKSAGVNVALVMEPLLVVCVHMYCLILFCFTTGEGKVDNLLIAHCWNRGICGGFQLRLLKYIFALLTIKEIEPCSQSN